jgi:cyclic pyranopterin phosphate synthase
MLSFEEILRLCSIFTKLGVRKVKVTGGEPLVRRGAAAFMRSLKAIPGIEAVTLTTNALLLSLCLDELSPAQDFPISAVNISLDTLDQKRFEAISGFTGNGIEITEILRGMEKALALALPVKINAVPLRGINEDDLAPLAELARHKVSAVRFIELMPLGVASAMTPIPGAEVKAVLEKKYGALTPFGEKLGYGPAVYYTLEGFAGKIGFINALSDGFCETCNRLRLTSEGILKPCLSSDMGTDLKSLLRNGACDHDIENAVIDLVAKKPLAHTFSDRYGNKTTGHSGGMFRTGG